MAIGPALHFDANWWLLIGTYAGLIGLNDGFVLRNICAVLSNYEDEQFAHVTYDDVDLEGGAPEAMSRMADGMAGVPEAPDERVDTNASEAPEGRAEPEAPKEPQGRADAKAPEVPKEPEGRADPEAPKPEAPKAVARDTA